MRTLPSVIDYLNQKYGDFEYAKDARALDVAHEFPRRFNELLERAKSVRSIRSVLITGANSGIELDLLTGLKVTALDLSDVALARLGKLHPDVPTFQGDIQNLPFPDKSFDMYVSMRSIHASNLDLARSLEESLRVTRFVAIYSISNGYNIEGRLVKGMYDYDSGEIDTELPYRTMEEAVRLLTARNCVCEVYEVPSEIVIYSDMQG
jgi:SAM-dependent methyltransferase